MGRPPVVLTDDQKAEVEMLAATLNKEQIADYLGVSRPTFDALLKRDEDLSLRYKRGLAKTIQTVADTLLSKALNGDVTSIIFYLKSQAGWKETIRNENFNAESLKAAVQELDDDDVLACAEATDSPSGA